MSLSVLVDKVMQPVAGWRTEQWMVQAAAAAGFNVYSPRRGFDDWNEVSQVLRWCQAAGIRLMPWMRGSLAAGPADQRLTWIGGEVQPIYSPNADELWDWWESNILEYARLSQHNQAMMGVFLDFENYAPNSQGPLYPLSYEPVFQFEHGGSGSPLSYEDFQLAHWEAKATGLREAITKLNPQFQFAIYPAPGDTPFEQVCMPAWSTPEAPIIAADASTYGRDPSNLDHRQALAMNRDKLLANADTLAGRGFPVQHMGGIDPIAAGADPEFCGKNALMISGITDGYWVFYEGPVHAEPMHTEYFDWFDWANRAASRKTTGDYRPQFEPRETPETGNMLVFDQMPPLPALVPPPPLAGFDFPPVLRVRSDVILVLACSAGVEAKVELMNFPVANWPADLQWDLRTVTKGRLASGRISYGATDTVRFTPAEDGIYLLGLGAGRGWFSLVSTNVPVGWHAGLKLEFIGDPATLYFNGRGGFSMQLYGSSSDETVSASVFQEDGTLAVGNHTTLEDNRVTLATATDDTIWSLETDQAPVGKLEDYAIQLAEGMSPVLSPFKGHVFALEVA